jgi:hypothetical protein
MPRSRLWIEVIALATAIACAIALLLATLGAATAELTASPAQNRVASAPQRAARPAAVHTYEGMITCTQCGAKHAANLGDNAGDCARQCVRSGAKFALIDGDTTYQLEGDPVMLKKFAGQRARIMGVAQGHVIKVSTAEGE